MWAYFSKKLELITIKSDTSKITLFSDEDKKKNISFFSFFAIVINLQYVICSHNPRLPESPKNHE